MKIQGNGSTFANLGGFSIFWKMDLHSVQLLQGQLVTDCIVLRWEFLVLLSNPGHSHTSHQLSATVSLWRVPVFEVAKAPRIPHTA